LPRNSSISLRCEWILASATRSAAACVAEAANSAAAISARASTSATAPVAPCAMAERATHQTTASTHSHRTLTLTPAGFRFLGAPLLQFTDGFAFEATYDTTRAWAAIPTLCNGFG